MTLKDLLEENGIQGSGGEDYDRNSEQISVGSVKPGESLVKQILTKLSKTNQAVTVECSGSDYDLKVVYIEANGRRLIDCRYKVHYTSFNHLDAEMEFKVLEDFIIDCVAGSNNMPIRMAAIDKITIEDCYIDDAFFAENDHFEMSENALLSAIILSYVLKPMR